MHGLTGFQRDLLVVIGGLDDPMGLDIKDHIDEYYESETNPGRLYPNIDTLVDKGFVAKGRKDDRTNEYTLSERGERALAARRDWENRYVRSSELVSDTEAR